MKYFHALDISAQLMKEIALLPQCSINDPFDYQPDEVVLMAAKQLQANLPTLAEGKMFGVLVVACEGRIGYLAAHSGQISDLNTDFFVPPVYDYLSPEGYFKREEAKISTLNHEIDAIQKSKAYQSSKAELEMLKIEAAEAIEQKRKTMAAAKTHRDARRKSENIGESEAQAMIAESQHLKAEWHRCKQYYAREIEQCAAGFNALYQKVEKLKAERRYRSDALQKWLFAQFVLESASGERKNLLDIFHQYYSANSQARVKAAQQITNSKGGNTQTNIAEQTLVLGSDKANAEHLTPIFLPPAGTGECCEPKLLQYALQHNMQPISMGMFWWGASPVKEIRRHGQFYPACNGKCKPILAFMLQGLKLRKNAALAPQEDEIKVVYEDDHLAVVAKPHGILSIPGRIEKASVEEIMRKRWSVYDSPIIVHRLDMDTSGLLLLAKEKQTYVQLQAMFLEHKVKKTYTALIDAAMWNEALPSEGQISLPLIADMQDRPRQMVDREYGKPALTQYKIVGKITLPCEPNLTMLKVKLKPITGRTHQLRVHCAHPQGLNCPIIGDNLYGTTAQRLYLHASKIEFQHPISGVEIKIDLPMW